MTLFVSFEGGEGSGKTTQVGILLRRLEEIGQPAIQLHEPGMTPLGTFAREWLKRSRRRDETITEGAELFLFAAARAEMVAKVLKPALGKNVVVVCDRYADSTTAYQGYGRNRDLRQVETINEIATDGVMPNLTILLDCPPEYGLRRVRSGQMELPLYADESPGGRFDPEGSRRYELEPVAFHKRVRDGYLKMAKREPDRWRVIDATRPPGDVADAVWQHVSQRLAELGTGVTTANESNGRRGPEPSRDYEGAPPCPK